MREIIVHNPCNEHTRYFRYYNLFWDDFTNELKKRYVVEENRYFEEAHYNKFSVNLIKQTCEQFLLLECEYVIEFKDTGDFFILSVSDELTDAILSERNNPHLKKVLISQFIPSKILHHVGENNYHKYSPWIYFPSIVLDLEQYYIKRQDKKEYIDKMYFRGSSLGDRPILNHINMNYLEGVSSIGNPEIYFEDLIKYKIGLSVGGRGELCYRDIEYMSIGIPFIRFEYLSKMNPELIPNFHYISVDRPNDMNLDRLGNYEHAKMIEEKFLEVKDDVDFLNFISKNGKEYYDTYLCRYKNIQRTLKLLFL